MNDTPTFKLKQENGALSGAIWRCFVCNTEWSSSVTESCPLCSEAWSAWRAELIRRVAAGREPGPPATDISPSETTFPKCD